MIPEPLAIDIIPHVAGRSHRVVGIDDAGRIYVGRILNGEGELAPAIVTTPDEAVHLARLVLSGHERTVADSAVLLCLAGAVIAARHRDDGLSGDASPAPTAVAPHEAVRGRLVDLIALIDDAWNRDDLDMDRLRKAADAGRKALLPEEVVR